jgi:hypothetical protein
MYQRELRKQLTGSLFVALLVFVATTAFGCTDIVAARVPLWTVRSSLPTPPTVLSTTPRYGSSPARPSPRGHADVYWNITAEEEGGPVKIGEIPQVETTYTYFHVGYPFMNEHGVAIGETTIARRKS